MGLWANVELDSDVDFVNVTRATDEHTRMILLSRTRVERLVLSSVPRRKAGC